ncbi:potassium transporter-domain-containing protein [Coniella lustricola]|uniref:Potassium transporter-domain-containing protein n=1 Tax=Coniella lustricola TaxID=2025994 RepID=A0A2T2ZS80_9PEZI|nr:potassium transporter-domain-containing protein [Coniella lustricola]
MPDSTTGVIYGDIGTSPLYVYSSTFTSQPSWLDLVGALSIIIWSLTLIVTVKYGFIVLSADDDGQGGTFALYSLLSRYINIVHRNPSEKGVRLERYRTGDLRPGARSVRRFLENSPASKTLLKVVGVLGVSMIMADGVLTPAQSVLGAIQGIRVVNPSLGTPVIIGVSCAILVILFALQPFGTSKLGTGFAPIVVVWLLFNLVSGIYNLAIYDYTVLKAFSPYFAFSYLIRNGEQGWRSLGGLLLAFTGVEALFADLGAFGKRAIQISWLCIAYPCLLFAYIGQAAYISQDASGTAWSNPFFSTVPPGTLIFSLILAVLAAIVASQALITSTFQLLSQIMRMSYFPHIKVVHTSHAFHEHIYLPLANWLLMIGTVIVTAVYNNTTSLGNAYGVCVICVTFITTCMVALVAIVVWRLPVLVVLPVWLVFACLDGMYLSAVLTKVPDGAWFTILLAALLCSIFILWRFGKEAQWAAEHMDRLTVSGLFVTERVDGATLGQGHPTSSASSSNSLTSSLQTRTQAVDTAAPTATTSSTRRKHTKTVTRLHPVFGHTQISTVPGLGIFFDKSGDLDFLPPSFTHFVRKFAVRPAVTVFFHMRPLPVASVPCAERYVVVQLRGSDTCTLTCTDNDLGDEHGEEPQGGGHGTSPYMYSVVLRHGYADDVLKPGMARELVAQIELAISRNATRQNNNDNINNNRNGVSRDGSELKALHAALEAQVVYVLGKETMRVKHQTGSVSLRGRWSPWTVVRRTLLWAFLWIRENSRTKLADLDIDVDKMVEVGFLKEI